MSPQYPRRRRPLRDRGSSRTDLSGPLSLAVVGESHYQPELAALAGPARPGGAEHRATFALVPEPSNPHDPHAVSVRVPGGGTVGYLARADARRYGPRVRAADDAGGATCDGVVLGGDSARGTGFGVWLHVVAAD